MHKLTTAELVSKKPSWEEFKKQPSFPITVILNNIRSLNNVGLVFRACDACRVEKLYLTGFTGYPAVENDNRDPKIIAHAQKEIEKTAIHTIGYQAWEYRPDAENLFKDLKTKGVQVVAVEQTASSVNYLEASYQFPLALLFGHEREGIEGSLLNLADLTVEIPMFGFGNSLNVAMSVAIMLYGLIKRRPPNL